MSARKNTLTLLMAAAALFAVSTTSAAPHLQGFETDDADWNFADGGTNSGRVLSGAGTLGLTSAAGDAHAELFNVPDSYQAGYGTAGYSFYGGADPVYAGDFFQSVDVYLDPAWSGLGLWVDMAPRDVSDTSFYAAEGNFRLTADGSAVAVQAINGPTIATITTAGWYTFEITWAKGANPTDLIDMTLNVYDAGAVNVGTWATQAIYPQGTHPGQSQYLGNNGYVWVTVWQNGFAGDVIAIDNAQTGLGTVAGNLGDSTTNTFKTSISPAGVADVDVTITCNGGLPLTQTALVGTTFTVTELAPGTVCTIALAEDLSEGWIADGYLYGQLGNAVTPGTESCDFIATDRITQWECIVEAAPAPYDYYVTVDWDISPDADPGIGSAAEVELECEGATNTSTTYAAGPTDTIPSPAIEDVVPPSKCSAMLVNAGSAVEVSGCDTSLFKIDGGDQSCVITATAFYEGIPTLSQYGMAIMALLMLGVGFVGFRRFI